MGNAPDPGANPSNPPPPEPEPCAYEKPVPAPKGDDGPPQDEEA